MNNALGNLTESTFKKRLRMNKFHSTLLWGILMAAACSGPVEPAGPADSGFVTEYLTPTRIVCTAGVVENAEHLLKPYVGQVQVSTDEPEVTSFGQGGYVLLDFGKEIQGGIQLVRTLSGSKDEIRFRIVLGESVTEALSRWDAPASTATNDHAVRDFELAVPWLGSVEVGNSGFRFARIELAEGRGDEIDLLAVRAISRKRDLEYLGSFRCSDERLNQIWQTGAYTVHLCMQDYLWDGIKRDRLVWMGDMHPEIMTVNTVFGNQQVVRKSLDYVRDKTAPTDWMNGICSYSLWWIILQHHLYEWYGDKAYLAEQGDYLQALLHSVMENVDGNREAYQDGRFIDWPSWPSAWETITCSRNAPSSRSNCALMCRMPWATARQRRCCPSKGSLTRMRHRPSSSGTVRRSSLPSWAITCWRRSHAAVIMPRLCNSPPTIGAG